jgi:hypothetical protein
MNEARQFAFAPMSTADVFQLEPRSLEESVQLLREIEIRLQKLSTEQLEGMQSSSMEQKTTLSAVALTQIKQELRERSRGSGHLSFDFGAHGKSF